MCTNDATTNYLVNTLVENKPNQLNTYHIKEVLKSKIWDSWPMDSLSSLLFERNANLSFHLSL